MAKRGGFNEGFYGLGISCPDSLVEGPLIGVPNGACRFFLNGNLPCICRLFSLMSHDTF